MLTTLVTHQRKQVLGRICPQILTSNDLESFLATKRCDTRLEFEAKLKEDPHGFLVLGSWDHVFEERTVLPDGSTKVREVTSKAFAFSSPALLKNMPAAMEGKGPDGLNLMADGTFKICNKGLVLIDVGTTTTEYNVATQEHRQHFMPTMYAVLASVIGTGTLCSPHLVLCANSITSLISTVGCIVVA